MVLMLDTKNKVIKEEIVSIGTLNGALIHPREVFKSAIKESANAIIMVQDYYGEGEGASGKEKA